MTIPVVRGQARRPRADMVLALLLATHVVLKVVVFPLVAGAPLEGDEAAYVDGGRALSNLVRDLSSFGPVDMEELRRNVVGSGWFMPGMSVVLTPLFVIDPDSSVIVIRAYLGVLSSLLLVLTALTVRRELGDLYAGALLVFPGLVPTWLLFSYSAWGDLWAGLLILVLVTHLIAIMRRLRDGRSPDLRQGTLLGLIAIAAVYFRSSATLLVFGMLIMIGASTVLLLRGRERSRGLQFLGSAIAVFVMVLLPWSTFASQTLDARVVTTTSVPIVLANTFGDTDRVCFGTCDPGSTIWFSPLRYSREVARATGRSEVEVQQQMSAYARTRVTPQSYTREVLSNLGRYTLHPGGFASSLRSHGANATGVAVSVAITVVMFFAMLAIVVAMMLAVLRKSFDQQVVSIALKLGLGALLAQPLVHLTGSRYWTTAAPLSALAAGLFIQVLRARHLANSPDDTSRPTPTAASSTDRSANRATLSRSLNVTQIALVAATVLIALVVLTLSR
ncbi:hypothetical protein [Aeromicrobium sp.]|uniref:hypothetical protein n=1 Tax=Aeromicrobium sp. TaxID=1871063 RepID=UPI0019C9CE88|nr:hypothetical protein [Aeromicrobium sp.]MBC7632837.1 hypothetical protein [Aeromicrobium sp.]